MSVGSTKLHDHVNIKPCHTKISFKEVNEDEKQATYRCKHCSVYYKHEENHPQACVHHHGRYVSSAFARKLTCASSYVSILVPSWTCCKDIRSDYPGCCISFHEEDEHTSTILEAIGERKQMIEEWRGKLDTKDIPIVIPGQKEGYLEKLQGTLDLLYFLTS